ncbi:hypothetical protein ABNM01_02380 [Pseudomonas syringae]
MIRIVSIWLATEPMDMRAGTETALARVIAVFGAAKPHCAYVTPGTRKVVLGLLVDGKSPRRPKTYKKYVSDHLYYLSHPTIDALTHAERRGFDSLQGLVNHVSGKIAYGFSIEPDWAKDQGNRLKEISAKLGVDHVLFP